MLTCNIICKPYTLICNHIFVICKKCVRQINFFIKNNDSCSGDNNLISPIEGVLLDPLSLIASKLLDNTVVGQNLKNFSFKAKIPKNRTSERIISDPCTGTIYI